MAEPFREDKQEILGKPHLRQIKKYHSIQEDTHLMVPASWWSRVFAFVIDGLIASSIIKIALTLIQFISNLISYNNPEAKALFITFSVFIFFVLFTHYYFIISIHKTGQTLGKKIMKIRIVSDSENSDISYFRVILREGIGKFISFILTLYAGIVLGAIRQDKKCLHDLMFNTKVVKL